MADLIEQYNSVVPVDQNYTYELLATVIDNPKRIAEYFGRVSGYTVEQTPIASGYAGYKDWFIESYDRPGYTIEAGLGINPLPMSQFEKIYRDNIGILLGGMTELP